MNLQGPQSDRDQLFKGAARNVRGNEQVYEGEVSRMQGENKSLKDHLQRSLRELKAYQMRYPSPFSSQEVKEDEPHWSASPEIMTPLFDAYDTRIRELEETIRQQGAQLESFKGNMDVLIRENEELRAVTLSKVKGGLGLDPSTPLHAEVVADLHEQVMVLRDENHLLVQKRAELGAELESHQSELQRQASIIGQQAQQLHSAVAEVQTLGARAAQAEKERDAAATQALSYSDAIGRAEIEQEGAGEAIQGLRNRLKASEALVVEFQKQLRALSSRSEDDSVSAFQRVHDAENRVRELHALLLTRTRELDSANETLGKLRVEYQTTRGDAEGMLQVMTGLERQLKEYAEREAMVERQEREGREKIEETLTVREQFNAREEKNKREIDRLMGERSAVSLRRRDEIEAAIDLSRKVLSEQIGRLEKDLDVLAERNAKLIFEAEKATRDGRSSRELLERLQRLHEEENKGVHASMRDLGEQLATALKGREAEAVRRLEAAQQSKELRQGADKLRDQLEESRGQWGLSERVNEASQGALKATVRDLQRDLAERSRSLARRSKELEDVKSAGSAQILALEGQHQEENGTLQRRAQEADRMASDLEAAGFAGDLRLQSSVDQLKERYVAGEVALEARLRAELAQVKGLTAKLRNAEGVIDDLLGEKACVSQQAEAALSEVRGLEEEIGACRATMSDLTQQLAASHQAREDGATRAARTIEQLQGGTGNGTRRSFAEYKDGTGGMGWGGVRLSSDSLGSAR
ncbi:hypothetical protein B484DRAFT_420672 [Ochromonadaceae sp. CCMP2298]|nr:hypothetical protein B484DRAFT_420672 [Ochromonadaceae sp. CCMP2298]